MKTDQTAVQTLVEYASALDELNVAPPTDVPSDAHGSRLKSAIAAGYDLNLRHGSPDQFWNWGLDDPQLAGEIEETAPGFNRYGTDGFCEQMYYSALRRLPIDDYADRSILEVGCGMGEGLNFLSRVTGARRLVGLDCSPMAIERASGRLSRGSQLRYIEGDAEKLPFDDGEFDIVVNIESSHNYPNLGRFFDEVARVLKPGGHFSYIDYFTAAGLERLAAAQDRPRPLAWTGSLDISADVKRAITERMRPGSHFSELGRRPDTPFPARIVLDEVRRMGYGARYIGLPPSRALQTMRALRVVPPTREMPAVESYIHQWARKPE